MATDIITLASARLQALPRYYTGIPCRRGHLSERYNSNTHCITCGQEDAAKRLEPGLKRDERLRARSDRRKSPEARAKDMEWVANNPDRVRAKAKKSYHKHRGKNLARSKKWRVENPDKREAYLNEFGREKAKAWRDAHKDELKAYYAGWQRDNKDRVYAYIHKRRARKKQCGGSHTAADIAEILKSQGYLCPYCKASLKRRKRHIDHVLPLALGGSNDRSNIQVLCPPCNLSKGSKHPIEFARERGLLL